MIRAITISQSHRRWALAVVAILAVAWAGFSAAGPWIARKLEDRLVQKLRERGLIVTWRTASWGPLLGLRLRDVRLRYEGETAAMATLGNVSLDIPLRGYVGLGNGHKLWKIENAPVTLHDADGEVRLESVTLRAEASQGQVDVLKFTCRSKGLVVDVSGGILFNQSAATAASPIRVDLRPVRGTLTVLDVEPGSGPFSVKGDFLVDARKTETTWKTNLSGSGEGVLSRGVRCSRVAADGVLSSSGSKVRYDIRAAHGSTLGDLSRDDWKESPVRFQGSLHDTAGVADDYQGSYEKGVFTIESLQGKADLWAISADFPAAGGGRPDKVEFHGLPEVIAKDCRRDGLANSPAWTIRSVSVKGDDRLAVKVGGREVEVTKFSATGAYDGKEWEIAKSQAHLLGGIVGVSGHYGSGVLRGATVEMEDFKVADLKRFTGGGGGKKLGRGVISGRYQGTLDFPAKTMEGHGHLTMDHAPVFEVPLLDEVYELFAAVVPGVERSEEGRFEADFKGGPEVVTVTRFKAKGGTLAVSATGTVDLKKKRVDGTARGKLTGLPGLVTSPLSRLLEMNVSGPYDDLRLRPLGPAKLASATASGTVGVAVDTLEETGKVTGTVIKESIKLPFRWLRGETGNGKSER